MIAKIEGIICDSDETGVIIMTSNGVGYGVQLSNDEQVSLSIGQSVSLYIAENIKEDSHDLYGFLQKSKKELYLQLTSVNGVGPKAAMSILTVDSEDEVRRAIAEGDTALLSRANGVGKKVAERVVVDLKNKVGLLASQDATDFLKDDTLADRDDAVQALVALGYSLIDAKFALSDVDRTLPLDTRVKQALKGFHGN